MQFLVLGVEWGLIRWQLEFQLSICLFFLLISVFSLAYYMITTVNIFSTLVYNFHEHKRLKYFTSTFLIFTLAFSVFILFRMYLGYMKAELAHFRLIIHLTFHKIKDKGHN